MENTLKNKLFVYKSYFWFILYFIIITFFWDYDDVDVTGFGITIVYTLVGLFAGLEIICIINRIRKKENGVDYSFNFILSLIFLVFAIITIISGIGLRSSEEKMANEYYDRYISLFKAENTDDFIEYIKSDETEKNQILAVSEEKVDRLLEIHKEIVDEPNSFYRYCRVFIYGNNLKSGYGKHHIGKKIYYLVYPILTFVSLIQFWFYMANSNKLSM